MAIVEDKPTTDEVIREVHRIKDELAKALGYDVRRILDDARKKQQLSGREIYRPPAH